MSDPGPCNCEQALMLQHELDLAKTNVLEWQTEAKRYIERVKLLEARRNAIRDMVDHGVAGFRTENGVAAWSTHVGAGGGSGKFTKPKEEKLSWTASVQGVEKPIPVHTTCKCGKTGEFPHPCPFQAEVHNNEFACLCCNECQAQCSEEI